jgi:hypothetical protein
LKKCQFYVFHMVVNYYFKKCKQWILCQDYDYKVINKHHKQTFTMYLFITVSSHSIYHWLFKFILYLFMYKICNLLYSKLIKCSKTSNWIFFSSWLDFWIE